MACLYIDQLKSHFPKIEPSIPRTKPNEKWCPQILLESLGSQTSDDYYISDEFAVRNAAMNFLPKVPKIFAIGLRLDCEDADNTSVSQCWNIDSMKAFLKQYFSIIRSYQNYFCTSWKSDPKETTDRSTRSFVSFQSVISGCSTKLREKSLKVQGTDCITTTRGENDSLRDIRVSTTEYYDLERVARQPKESNTGGEAIVTNKTRNRKSNCTMTSAISLSPNEKKDHQHTGHTFHDSRKSKSKRHVCIQTVERSRSRHGKSTQCHEQKQKEIASSKDVETIFAANSENFNMERCNADLGLLRTRQAREGSTRVQRSRTEDRLKRKCGTEKSSKRKSDIQPNASTSTKENIIYLTNGVEGVTGREQRRFLKKKGREPMRNVISLNRATSDFDNSTSYTGDNLTTIYQNYNGNTRKKSLMLIRNEHYDIRRILGTKVENYADPSRPRYTNQQTSYESLYSTKPDRNPLAARNTLWGSRNYTVEDKSSELTILGNVKKRLEEDYDDYFSLKDIDLENDLFVDAKDLDSLTKIEAKANDYTLLDKLKKPRSMSTTSLTKRKELQQELRVRSFRTSLTRSTPPSLQILNTDLHRMERSSCHSSLRERECSPSSSIEYCTASSLSLTNLQSSSRDDSVSMLFQSCSVDTRVPLYDGSLKTFERRRCFSKDSLQPPHDGDSNTSEGRHRFLNGEGEEVSSLDEDEVFLDTKEFTDRTLVDSCTVCCYQRNSTPKFANSSKLVTESLDSGILTDCSRGGRVRIVSDDQLRWTADEHGDESRKCCARQTDLLPTYDFGTDSSYSDESLDRRVDVAVKKFTENLILSERRARNRLQRTENPARHRQERKRRKKGRQVKNVPKSFPKRSSTCVFETSSRFYDEDWLISSSSPPLYSVSESEMDHL